MNNNGPDSLDQIVSVDKTLYSTQAATVGILLFAYLVRNKLLLESEFKSGVHLAAISRHLVDSLLSNFIFRISS